MTKMSDEETCWCGGPIGPRVPGDENGVGCVTSIFHDWKAGSGELEISRLYIAGPMSGRPDLNFPAFNDAAKWLRGLGFEVVNPAEYGADGGSYEDLLRHDLQEMLTCQGLALLDEWWSSVGARNEVQVAGLLKMPCLPVQEWQRYTTQPREGETTL